MNKVIFYAYILLGFAFFALSIYNFIYAREGNYAPYYDLLIALLLFYRVYRIYQTKKNQELM
jgi:hypothetical protein